LGNSGPKWRNSDKDGAAQRRNIAVQVAAILLKQAKQGDSEKLRCNNWELVLPEIVYLPDEDAA